MAKKKPIKTDEEEVVKKRDGDSSDEETVGGEDALDPAIIEDTFAEEFSEYNDVDNF